MTSTALRVLSKTFSTDSPSFAVRRATGPRLSSQVSATERHRIRMKSRSASFDKSPSSLAVARSHHKRCNASAPACHISDDWCPEKQRNGGFFVASQKDGLVLAVTSLRCRSDSQSTLAANSNAAQQQGGRGVE
jgi:hypothetical protein